MIEPKLKTSKADSIVVQLEQIRLISNGQNLAKDIQRKIYPSKIVFWTKININQEEIFSRWKVILYVVESIRYYFSETKPLRWVSIRFKIETYNEDNFLNQTTLLTVARATVFYCILCGRRKESAAVRRIMTHQQHRRKLNTARQTKQ